MQVKSLSTYATFYLGKICKMFVHHSMELTYVSTSVAEPVEPNFFENPEPKLSG